MDCGIIFPDCEYIGLGYTDVPEKVFELPIKLLVALDELLGPPIVLLEPLIVLSAPLVINSGDYYFFELSSILFTDCT
jgi:hypothetical protein